MKFRNVELEVVRPGPPHNQLVSPLTQYIALCGESSPITFRLEFEHRRLLSRLDRLRYRESQEARQRELVELGEDVGKIFAAIPSLAAEVAKGQPDTADADRDTAEIVHLRLVLSGSELSLVPFEVAIAPQAMPGEGTGMLLQGRIPLVPTREIRRSRPLPVRLDREDQVKVLFAYAAPRASAGVPSNEHLYALRQALDPWIGPPRPLMSHESHRPDLPRLEDVKRHLRVLPDASLDDIYTICTEEAFTHVHILAHGESYHEAGEERFGIVLRSDRDPDGDVVSGHRLAQALGAESRDGNSRNAPY